MNNTINNLLGLQRIDNELVDGFARLMNMYMENYSRRLEELAQINFFDKSSNLNGITINKISNEKFEYDYTFWKEGEHYEIKIMPEDFIFYRGQQILLGSNSMQDWIKNKARFYAKTYPDEMRLIEKNNHEHLEAAIRRVVKNLDWLKVTSYKPDSFVGMKSDGLSVFILINGKSSENNAYSRLNYRIGKDDAEPIPRNLKFIYPNESLASNIIKKAFYDIQIKLGVDDA